ncbi:MAG: alpha/beta fold hydrolase [Chloroflexota bacterium]|nr:alpha/beta fold hydrolase [Chloroflexota bacterium]
MAGIGLAGGAALLTARHLLTTPQALESGLPGEAGVDRAHGGDVHYVVAGPADARPLVLLHGFYPGASNYEYHAIFARLAETNRVYAPDWLGFGMSERPAINHTGEFYAAMLAGFLRDVVAAPAAVVAHGLAGNIATRVAADAPDLFDRLALVAPESEAGMRIDPTPSQLVARLFQKVALGITPYAILSLRPALRIAAGRRSAVGPLEVDERTLDHLYASAHQFGGEYGALALLTGELDLPIRYVFPLLQVPTLIIVGARDERHPLHEMEGLVALNPRADLEMIANAGETVFLDQPTLFTHTLHRWLARRVVRHEPTPRVARVAPLVASAATTGAAVAPATPALATARPVTTAPMPRPAPEPTPTAAPHPVKIVPVLEPDTRRPREARTLRTPDSATHGNGADPGRSVQSLGPDEQPRSSGGASDPMARFTAPEPGHARPTPPVNGAYHYPPESRAHVLRSDNERGSGASRRRR